MKNFIRLFVLMLTLACLFTSCDLFEKGGTISVTNTSSSTAYVIIVKGTNVEKAFKDLVADKGTQIAGKATKKFEQKTDGMYSVAYLITGSLTPGVKLASYLAVGATVKVDIP